MRLLCTWLALLAGLGIALSVPGKAAEKTDADTINKLITKLSSNRFAEREKAQKALEEIGLPALDALRKAAEESKDMEAQRRAKELVAKLEKKALAAKILAPKRLRLTYKNTPLSEAIADFKKQSGYDIVLHDPDKKLKDRTITLDTGDTTFWEAYDQFCAKAGLVEASAADLIQQRLNGPGGGGGIGVPGQQLPPLQFQRIKPIQKLPLEKPPPQKDVRGPQLKAEFAVAVADNVPAQVAQKKEADAKAAAQAKAKEAAKAAQAPPAIQPPPAVPAPAVQVQPGVRLWRRPQPFQPAGQPGQILLKDGKVKDLPTSYTGAIRVQATGDVQQLFGGAAVGEYLVGLKVSPEPKIRWQSLVALRIDKAVDDQGQTLTQAMDAPGGPGGPVNPFGGVGGGFGRPAFFPGVGTLHQNLPVRLKKGDKESKSLRELAGNLTAQVLAEPEVHITADNILKASGKTFKGKEGGFIKVVGVDEKDQNLTLRLEVEQPANVVPANQGFGGAWGGFNGGGIMPAPARAPAKRAPALPKGAFQVQVQAQPAIQVAPVQIQVQQIQIGGGGAIIIGGGPGSGSTGGLELLDEKGKVIPYISAGFSGRGLPGGGFTTEHQMTFQLQKDQKAAKLVFKGSKSVNIDIPFTLKNVPLK
ncbi:MAG: hypothetical protein HYS12_14500 [Planctomycetes bacterium]|nr:hypothetical protein [Planctomycetota bacterium]